MSDNTQQNTALLAQDYLDRDNNHRIHIARFGNEQGIPLLFIHGGPGSSCNPNLAPLFALDDCHLLQWDQRGCGDSTAQAVLTNNTTVDLLADMEAIREHYGFEQWLIYGGSWGATLALEYAKAYPQRVLGILLRGSFLARKVDLDWFIKPDGLATQLPDDYQALHHALQPSHHQSLIERLEEVLTDESLPLDERYDYAQAWDSWEMAAMGFASSSSSSTASIESKRKAVQQMSIYSHYGANGFFLADRQQGVLQNIERLADIPAIAVQGKNDRVCPLHLVQDLKQAWPLLDWRVVDAGHALEGNVMRDSVEVALQDLLKRL